MKFDITIKDATIEEVQSIVEKLTTKLAAAQEYQFPQPELTFVEDEEIDVTGQLDKDGLPWDARIHSSNKKMKADGSWTRRRGVDDVEFDRVKAELRGAVFNPSQAQGLQFTPAAAFEAVDTNEIVNPAVPQFAPVPVAAPQFAPQPIAAKSAQYGLNDIIVKIQTGMQTGKINQEYVQKLIAWVNGQFGLQGVSLVDYAARPDVCNTIYQTLIEAGL